MAESTDDRRARIAALEAELKSERAQFALAERAARIGYWRIRLADGSVMWSPGMYRLLGIDPEKQSPDIEWLESQIRPDDVIVLRSKIDTAIRTRSSFYYRTHAIDTGAAVQVVDTFGEVEIGPDGSVISIIGVCYDLTQQLKIEGERAQAEKRYRLMMEEASDIIMLHGPNGRVEFASGALERILGRSLREFDSAGFFAIVHPEDRAEAEKVARRPPEGETYTATYRAKHADGHYVWIEVTTRSVFDEETGEFRHVVAVSRDVGERKLQELEMRAAREAAEAANRAKSVFLANMSHELRTPLNAILGFADIMRDEMFGPIENERYREYVSLIHSSGQLLLELIGDILDMAKIEAGKLQLKFENLNVSEVVGECVQIMSDRAKRGGVTLQVGKSGATCAADRRALKQILLNVLSNAVKFTPAGGRIEIAVSQTDDCVRISVADTGIGIAAEDLPRIGTPFEQVCADPKLAKKGTGLGLALVRALTEKHGGRFSIESRLHSGTTVTIELPRLAAIPAQVA